MNALKEQLRLIRERPQNEQYRIKTFGLQNNIRISHEKISVGDLKEIISGTLRLCYLCQPILRAVHTKEPINLESNSSLFELKTVLLVLSEGLFYQYMIKVKAKANYVGDFINLSSTEHNHRIIFAALIVFYSRRLTLQQIDSALLIFNLESALLQKQFQSIPIENNFLLRLLSKIERTISSNDLKMFLNQVRQDNQSQYLEPYYFVYLTALSHKKSSSPNLLHFYRHKNEKHEKIQNFQNKEQGQKKRSKTLQGPKVTGIQFYKDSVIKKVNIKFQEIKKVLSIKQRSKSTFSQQSIKEKRPRSPTFQKSMAAFDSFIAVKNNFEYQLQKNKQKETLIKISANKLHNKKNLKIRSYYNTNH